jgi:hypothetical protein
MNLTDAAINALMQLPEVKIHRVERESRVASHGETHIVDLVATGEVKGQPVRFLIELRTNGYPRDVRNAISLFADLQHSSQSEVDVPILVAPAISETSRELLRKNRIAYWDSSGSIYVDLPWALYWIDRPVPSQGPRPLRDIFRGSSAQVLHALLREPERTWHLNDLAQIAQVSASTAHQVCTFLERQLWMDKEGAGPQTVRILRQPGALLDAWADAYSWASYEIQRYFRWTRHPEELLSDAVDALTDFEIDYALTLDTGAQLVAPHGTGTGRIWVVVPAEATSKLSELTRTADLEPVEEGEALTFLIAQESTPLLFRRQVQGLWVVSDIQLYLDLWTWPQRGKEQARHLRAERMSF